MANLAKLTLIGLVAGCLLTAALMTGIWLFAGSNEALAKLPYGTAAGALAAGMLMSRRLGRSSPGSRLLGLLVGLGVGLLAPLGTWLIVYRLSPALNTGPLTMLAIISAACGFVGASLSGRRSKLDAMAEEARLRRIRKNRSGDY